MINIMCSMKVDMWYDDGKDGTPQEHLQVKSLQLILHWSQFYVTVHVIAVKRLQDLQWRKTGIVHNI